MDDNKRQLVTLAVVPVLFGLGYLAYTQYFDKPPQPDPHHQQAQQHPQQPTKQPAEDPAARAARQQARQAAARTVRIRTDELDVELTNLNTAIRHARLRVTRFRGQEMVTTDKERYLPMNMSLLGIDIPEDAVWEAEQLTDRAVRFRWHGHGVTVTRKVEAGSAPYQLWSTLRIENETERPIPVRVEMGTYHYVPRDEEGTSFFGGSQTAAVGHGICAYGDDIVRLDRKSASKFESPEGHGYGPDVRFVGIENRYFANVLVSEDGRAARCKLRGSDRPNSEDAQGTLFETRLAYPRAVIAPHAAHVVRTMAYIGPKDETALAAAGHSLTRVVDRGWFSMLAGYLVIALRMVYGWVGNWGLAIILLTICVRIVLFPLTLKSFQSLGRMRALKPEIDKVNEKFGDDREAKGAAMMELYKKHKINPLGGCLPQLLQLPVWFAFYASLSTNIELYHVKFIGFWTDLSAPDPYFVLPIILGALMIVQQKITPSTMDPMQAKIMMYVMPIMVTSFMLFLPAGLCLYMATNSVLGIAQQQLITRSVAKEKKPAAVADATPGGDSDGDKMIGTGEAREPGKAGGQTKTKQEKRRVRRG